MIKFLSFTIGLFSLFFLPNFYNIKIVDVTLLLSFFLLIIVFISKKRINKIYFVGFILISIYLIVSIYGCILNTGSYKGILVAIRYFLVLSTVFLLKHLNKKFLVFFEKGFVLSAYISAFWIFIDTYYYYTHGNVSINEILFSNLYNGDHRLTNRYLCCNLFLLRASGIGWDPGGIGPALLIAYIINYFKRYYKYNFLIFFAIILTMSKTTYLVFLFFLLYMFFKKIKYFNLFFIISIFISLFILSASNLTFIKDEGTIRHIKYPSSIIYIFNSSMSEMLLGYGYRGTAEFFYNRVPWFKENSFVENYEQSRNKVVESTFTNIFLYGGLIGSIIYIIVFAIILSFGNFYERTIIIFLLISFIGYTFENLWTNFLIYGIFLNTLEKIYNKRRF